MRSYEGRALRGVNLGGWLVLEPWMTPALFAGIDAPDELTYCQKAGKRQLDRLAHHRDQFITKKDFQWLKAHGIGAVRIPVGYWLFGDVDPFAGTVTYLDKAFEWAEATGLKVLISLHGAPGSQNGEMHSGQKGSVAWHSDEANIDMTLDIVKRLAERYHRSPAMLGISLLNEPSTSLPKRTLKRFYRQAHRIIRQQAGKKVWVVFSDGFQPSRWSFVLHRWLYPRTYIDTHQYQIYTQADKAMSVADHLRRTVADVPLVLNRMRRHHPVIVGEWSAALDPLSMTGLDTEETQQAYAAYITAQIQAYDRMDAWFYWNYKTEGGGPWSYRDCYEKGWFDNPKK